MRIILADHHDYSRWTIKTSLEKQQEFDLIGETTDAMGLLVMAEKRNADLVLLDSELPGLYIEDLITCLHALATRPIVIVMSSKLENSRKLLTAGADAFVTKSDEADWLLETLHKYEKRIKKI